MHALDSKWAQLIWFYQMGPTHLVLLDVKSRQASHCVMEIWLDIKYQCQAQTNLINPISESNFKQNQMSWPITSYFLSSGISKYNWVLKMPVSFFQIRLLVFKAQWSKSWSCHGRSNFFTFFHRLRHPFLAEKKKRMNG